MAFTKIKLTNTTPGVFSSYLTLKLDDVVRNDVGVLVQEDGQIIIPRTGKYKFKYSLAQSQLSSTYASRGYLYINGVQSSGKFPESNTYYSFNYTMDIGDVKYSSGRTEYNTRVGDLNAIGHLYATGVAEFELEEGDAITLVFQQRSTTNVTIHGTDNGEETYLEIEDDQIILPETGEDTNLIKVDTQPSLNVIDIYEMDFSKAPSLSVLETDNGNKLIRSLAYRDIFEYNGNKTAFGYESTLRFEFNDFTKKIIETNKPLYFVTTYRSKQAEIVKRLTFVYGKEEQYSQEGHFITLTGINAQITENTIVASNIDHNIVDAINNDLDDEATQEYKKTQIQYDQQNENKFVYPDTMNQYNISGYNLPQLITKLITECYITPKRILNGVVDTFGAGWRIFPGMLLPQLNDLIDYTNVFDEKIEANPTLYDIIQTLLEKWEVSESITFEFKPTEDNLNYQLVTRKGSLFNLNLTSNLDNIESYSLGGFYDSTSVYTGFAEGITTHSSGLYSTINKIARPFEEIIDTKQKAGNNSIINDEITNRFTNLNAPRESLNITLKQGLNYQIAGVDVGDSVYLTTPAGTYLKIVKEINETIDVNGLQIIYGLE